MLPNIAGPRISAHVNASIKAYMLDHCRFSELSLKITRHSINKFLGVQVMFPRHPAHNPMSKKLDMQFPENTLKIVFQGPNSLSNKKILKQMMASKLN